jgi:hypothetical protein
LYNDEVLFIDTVTRDFPIFFDKTHIKICNRAFCSVIKSLQQRHFCHIGGVIELLKANFNLDFNFKKIEKNVY